MVLVQMAQRLRNLFRESDYLIRWGGEEFLVVARATNRSEAEAVAERIRAAVANEAFELADGTTLSKSCSIGFASYPFFPDQPRILSWSQVLELADQSLYMAKNGGRNQWIGLYGMACSQPDGVFQRLMRQTIKAVQAGEVRLVSSSR
jgi:diguanylate cyclase (GGDEF)-like protein